MHEIRGSARGAWHASEVAMNETLNEVRRGASVVRAKMLSAAVLLAVAAGCSGGGSSPSSSSSTQQADVQGTGTCHYPATVDVNSSPSGAGCFARPPAQICEVSNGATVNVDGGVSGGTESCSSLCGPSQYEMTCTDTNDGPDPALGCQVIPVPTPSCCLYYCCPCAD
jgi:hypothetical protein